MTLFAGEGGVEGYLQANWANGGALPLFCPHLLLLLP